MPNLKVRAGVVLAIAVVGVQAVFVVPAPAQEPLRQRRSIFGMHNLRDGGPLDTVGLDWTKQLVGTGGFAFDWVNNDTGWLEKVIDRGMIPCVRVENGPVGSCGDPGAWYPGSVAATILNWKLAKPQYANKIIYLQIWNEPSDPRDCIDPGIYANYLVTAYNDIKGQEANAAVTNPAIAGTMKVMTPGQNGPSWWNSACTANPNVKFAFDVWGTHPYPEANPPHYNLHDGDVYIETSKTVDSYLMDLDIIAQPHGNPPKKRRGFPVMITETAYGDHLGISYEGWPKTSRQMAADYNVSAFGTFWYQWPEIIAVQPYLLSAQAWAGFGWVQTSSSTNPDGTPTAPWPQYTDTRNLRISLNLPGGRTSPYTGAIGHITGTITRSDTGAVVPRATIFTDGYEFGNVSLYDGIYEVHDVPVGTYTLGCQKNGFATATQQITVTSGQTTTANFSIVHTGKISKGFYFVDTFAGHSGCPSCSLSFTYHAQSFTTPSDVGFIKYAACKPNVDNVTIQFSIRQGSPNGTQIGSTMSATLEPGVGGNMIGGEWPDGQEPAVLPNTQYYLRWQRSDGASLYCYASNGNPYSGGNAYPGGTSQAGWDMYSLIRGLTPAVSTAVGTIAGTVKDTSNNPLSGATVSTSPATTTVTTNASGAYTISNVPVGTYSVTASKVGYTAGTINNQVVNVNQTTTVNFNLAVGPTTGTITGTIRDASNNNPISGATVDTTTGGYSTTTNGSGVYTLNNVTPATYTVRTAKTGYVTNQLTGVNVLAGQSTTANINISPVAPFSGIVNGNFEGGFYNNPDADHQSGNSWIRFSESGASKTGGDFNVWHSTHWGQTIYEANWIAGLYQQATNATLGNAYQGSVWVRGADSNVKFWIGVDPVGGTSSTSANILWSAMSSPGTTWTQITSPSAVASSSTITLFIRAQNIAAANKNAWIDDAALVDQGSTATGSITGTVKDVSNNPLNGATVQTTVGGYTTTTNASGVYTLSTVAVGTYDVVASKSGYTSQTQSAVQVLANQATTVNFNLATAPSSGTLAGTVKDTNNTAISGATVSTNTGGYSTTSDASGNYTINTVAVGTYNVTASKTGYLSQTQNSQTVAAGQTTTVNFNLKRNVVEDFGAVPGWSSTFDAGWGGIASFSSVAGGQAGNCLQGTRSNTGSSARVMYYDVTPNTSYTVHLYMRCPSSTDAYWRECFYKLGQFTAQDYDQNAGTWTEIKKFANTGVNGNGDAWVVYSKTFNSGANTKVSVGFKIGNSGGTAPTMKWDTLRID